MTAANRRIFSQRIARVVGTHDMDRRPKDPASQKMKGICGLDLFPLTANCSLPFLSAIDWHIFIITTSVWAAEGLISDELLTTWCHYRNGYITLVDGQLTPEKRAFARAEFFLYGQGLQRNLGITACTISTHMVVVEADLQIPVTGPISESMGSWVERLMFTLLEHSRRRLSFLTILLLRILKHFSIVSQTHHERAREGDGHRLLA
jgi:hypothetical protein